jgi:AI-2 transport protein TqsA
MAVEERKGARFLLVVASFVVVIAGIKAAAPLILPFMIASFIAVISLPLLNWLQSKRIPNAPAVLITVTLALGVLVVLGLLIGGSIKSFTEEAPRYRERLAEMSLPVMHRLQAWGFDVSDDALSELINVGAAMDVLTGTLRAIAAVLSRSMLVFLIIVFILFEAAGFPAKLDAAFGDRPSGRLLKIRHEVQRYLATKTVISFTTGSLIGAALSIIGVDFPLLWGALAFMLNYIPNLGSIIAAMPPALLALVQLGPGHALAVIIVFLAVNVTLGNLIEPYFMGRTLGLSTLVVFLSLVFWGWVWGPVGMLLSVPLTMIVKILLENTEDLRWVAVLLGATPRPQAAGNAEDAS